MDKYDTYSYAEADVEVIKLVNDHNRKTEEARNEREARKKARQLSHILGKLAATVFCVLLLTAAIRGYSGLPVTALCVVGTLVSASGLAEAMWRWAK